MKIKRPKSRVFSAAMYEVVDNQLRGENPPETKQTLERLLAEGHSPEDARRMLAAVVASEVFEVLKRKQPYDPARYVAALQRLPKLPGEP
jgi:hypothetical protein